MEYVKLNTICTFKQWKTIPAKDLKECGYPVWGANGVIGFSNSYNHELPTIMICCRGATCGAINISEGKCYINGNAMAMDNLSRDYDINYVAYFLRSYDFKQIITGAAQPQITQIGLQKVKIPKLSLDEQRNIVEKLLSIDSAVANKKKQLEAFDNLIKSRFIGREVAA